MITRSTDEETDAQAGLALLGWDGAMALAAEVVASDGWSQAKTPPGPPQSQPTSQAAQSALHGKKRAADGELEGEQRLSKRFDLLNLGTSRPSRA